VGQPVVQPSRCSGSDPERSGNPITARIVWIWGEFDTEAARSFRGRGSSEAPARQITDYEGQHRRLDDGDGFIRAGVGEAEPDTPGPRDFLRGFVPESKPALPGKPKRSAYAENGSDRGGAAPGKRLVVRRSLH